MGMQLRHISAIFSGLRHGVVDVDDDITVARRLRVPQVPCIGAVVDGRAIHFDTAEYSIRSLRDFTRKLFSSDLITIVSSSHTSTSTVKAA